MCAHLRLYSPAGLRHAPSGGLKRLTSLSIWVSLETIFTVSSEGGILGRNPSPSSAMIRSDRGLRHDKPQRSHRLRQELQVAIHKHQKEVNSDKRKRFLSRAEAMSRIYSSLTGIYNQFSCNTTHSCTIVIVDRRHPLMRESTLGFRERKKKERQVHHFDSKQQYTIATETCWFQDAIRTSRAKLFMSGRSARMRQMPQRYPWYLVWNTAILRRHRTRHMNKTIRQLKLSGVLSALPVDGRQILRQESHQVLALRPEKEVSKPSQRILRCPGEEMGQNMHTQVC